jgi:fimbrial chaperone protein
MQTPSTLLSISKMARFSLGALTGALLFFSNLATADGISVNPIRLELEPGQRTATLTVTNDTTDTKVMQVQVTHWTQVNGESVYEPASDVIATPLLFRVAPQGRQLLRVGFTNPPADASHERTYRIYLNEVAEDKGDSSQIRFLLRLGIPLFVPPAKVQDALEWQLQRRTDGKLLLSAENRGNRHVRLQDLRLEDSNGSLVEQQELNYLLAGSRREWLLSPERAPSGSVKLKALSGRGVLETELRDGVR